MNSAKISEKIAHLAKQFNVRTPTVCLHCKVVSTHVIFSSIMIIIFDTRKEAIIDKVMTDDMFYICGHYVYQMQNRISLTISSRK